MRILHITDTHLSADEDAVLYGQQTAASLSRVLDAARRDGWPPAAVLVTGDLTHDETERGYLRFHKMLKDLDCPVHCLPGNHDISDLMYADLATPPFSVNQSVPLNGWLIVMLDSSVPGSDDGKLGDSELTRLEAALAENPDRHALVCLHHNPVPMGSAWLDRMTLQDADAFFDILGRHDNVRAVLWGHVHQAFDQVNGSIRMLSTPSTFAQFKPQTERFSLDTKPGAWRWLDLHPDGRIDTQLCWLNGIGA